MRGKGNIKRLEKIVMSDPHYQSDVTCRYQKEFDKIEDWKVQFLIRDYEDKVKIKNENVKITGIEYSLLFKRPNSKSELLDFEKIRYEKDIELKEYDIGVDSAQIAFGANDNAEEIIEYSQNIDKLDVEELLSNYNPDFAISTGSDGLFGNIQEGVRNGETQLILFSGFLDEFAGIERIKDLMSYFEKQFKIEDIELETEKLKVLYKEIGKKPKVLEIDDTLEAKQKIVGGLIEVVPYKNNMLLICNEEGKILDLPPNLKFENDYIAGNCFVVGDDLKNSGFKSLTKEEIRTARKDLNERAVEYESIKDNDKEKSNEMEVE